MLITNVNKFKQMLRNVFKWKLTLSWAWHSLAQLSPSLFFQFWHDFEFHVMSTRWPNVHWSIVKEANIILKPGKGDVTRSYSGDPLKIHKTSVLGLCSCVAKLFHDVSLCFPSILEEWVKGFISDRWLQSHSCSLSSTESVWMHTLVLYKTSKIQVRLWTIIS